ncbi:hypothetical protein BU17DRAFT_45701 [Hysterangium stoloniferum]|nr:hypothetical protein BU17DRAFT_45701 [Hysterangium stoloniferum]
MDVAETHFRDDLRLSEANILSVAEYLSGTIGYRTVGTKEHAEGDAWMVAQAKNAQKECERIVKDVHPGRNLECEVWRQEGSGKHRFDMMGYRLYKTYVDLTNIIIRVSNGTAAGKEHAILVNSHLDSTPPSPGAADDALPVGVMLECLRVLTHTKDWEPSHSIIFLFNNAEESLQDGSHLYATQHTTARTVRAVINLEAAGMQGPELLFQATSEEMVEAYAKVPRPYGTVLANDIFSSGIILSDTDFRQFEEYLNVTGVDMAVVGHSYFYHTQKDIVANIEPGVAQHMAENTLALLQHFTSPTSPLPSLISVTPHKPQIVYFTVLGRWFFKYTFSTASTLYLTLCGASFTFLSMVTQAPSTISVIKSHLPGMRNVLIGLVGSIISANVVALVMDKVMGKALSWYSREWFPIVLYGPAAVTGALLPQLLFFDAAQNSESITLRSVLLLFSTLAMIFQSLFQFGSSVFLFVPALAVFLMLLVNTALGGQHDEIPLRTYLVAGVVPLIIGAEVWCGTADVFVPLTGRMGEKAPAEYIIASMTAFIGFYTFPLSIPLAHRFGRKAIQVGVALFATITLASMAFMSMKHPFDSRHPKRVFVMHSENVTTGKVHINFAGADGSPTLAPLVTEMASKFGEVHRGPEYALSSVEMNDWNGDWDTLYPFSAFLTPYQIRLPDVDVKKRDANKFKVTAINNVIDAKAGTRSLTLQIDHPGVIWTVIAFDAHVLKWSLDDNPPPQFARHHIKEASFYGVNTWTVDLVMKLPDGDPEAGLKVHFVGTKESTQWPAKKSLKATGQGEGLQLLEDIHSWLKSHSDDSIDALLFGTVGGVTVV